MGKYKIEELSDVSLRGTHLLKYLHVKIHDGNLSAFDLIVEMSNIFTTFLCIWILLSVVKGSGNDFKLPNQATCMYKYMEKYGQLNASETVELPVIISVIAHFFLIFISHF